MFNYESLLFFANFARGIQGREDYLEDLDHQDQRLLSWGGKSHMEAR